MKSSVRYLLPAILGGALATSAWATTVVRVAQPQRITIAKSDPAHVWVAKSDKNAPLEKVTFLGVETGAVPDVLASQLGLDRDVGLVVRRVADESPSTGVLHEHDVITKFADQVLIDPRQLGVLVRAKKPGDEVKLTLFRGGKETVVTVKLGEHEAPRAMSFHFGQGGDDVFRFFHGGQEGALPGMREMPGAAREEIDEALRIIGGERGNWVSGPRVHIVKRHGGGTSLLNMAEGNFVYSDDEGSIEVTATKGERELTVKDAKGAVSFKGPITTDEQRDKLPAEVKKRLQKIDNAEIDFQSDENIESEGAAVKPAKTHTSIKVIRGSGSAAGVTQPGI